ncbi:MAG: hypothetical protein J6J36_07525 [Clostridia bacterium]|nr:hypothetical protein [Clostridia bacterium]
MGKQIIILNNSSSVLSKDNINSLIIEINKLKINRPMKELLLIASTNLLSSVKTTKGLIYQLESFRNQGKVLPEKTKSKYLNKIIADLKQLSISDFTTNINNLISYLETNNISLTIKAS